MDIVAAGQFPDEPGIDGTEQEIARLGPGAHAGNIVETGQHCRHASDVVATFATGLSTAKDEVFNAVWVELRDLGEDFTNRKTGEVVGSTVLE